MRYLIAWVAIVVLSGCERNGEGYGANNGAADSGAAQAPSPPKSDTLKITYSKTDPFDQTQAEGKKTKGEPAAHVHDHAGHESMEKQSTEKTPTHEEHPHK